MRGKEIHEELCSIPEERKKNQWSRKVEIDKQWREPRLSPEASLSIPQSADECMHMENLPNSAQAQCPQCPRSDQGSTDLLQRTCFFLPSLLLQKLFLEQLSKFKMALAARWNNVFYGCIGSM